MGSSTSSTFVSVCSSIVDDVEAELVAVAVVVAARETECLLGSRRLNISRETNTHARLGIISATLVVFLASVVCLHVCHRGCGAARYFLCNDVRIQTQLPW